MPNRRSSRRLHPALAVLMALALHAGLLFAVRSTRAQQRQRPLDVATTIELSLADDHAPARPLTAERDTPPPTPDRTAPQRGRGGHAAAARAASTADLAASAEAVASEAAAAASETASGSGDTATPHGIDLGLNGGVRRAALSEGWLEPDTKPKPPSDGGLRDGLAALDAQRGQSRSNPANHAAYQAARLYAPPKGMGIFDILTDERGVVLSVTLTSAPADEARWQRVGLELRELLKERRLRVPPGAKGLAARLRIETGDLAKELADRFHSERGAALGQAPLHAREARAESTRESLEPGKLSPTLGVTLAGGGSGQTIRVVLLSERAL